MVPVLVRSPAWIRMSPGGSSGWVLWVSDMQTTLIGCCGGAIDGMEGECKGLRDRSFVARLRRRWPGSLTTLGVLVEPGTLREDIASRMRLL